MNKLDGNERWKTKMLLPEHHEQYEKRNGPKKTSRPTSEEIAMVRDCILLPYILTMIQRSMDDIAHSSNLLKQLYLAAAQAVMNRISEDLYGIRRELARRDIKIISDEQVDLVIYHRFVCRGYEDRFGMVREVMRSEISMRLSKYLKEVVDRLPSKHTGRSIRQQDEKAGLPTRSEQP